MVTHRATGIGSLPGEDYADAVQMVLGEAGDLPYLPELPARGPHASMIGRTMAVVAELGADLQPAGWRLTDAPGVDHRRARSLLAQDLDVVEELVAAGVASFKVQVAGPWTLAALVERPRGDKVLADVGARRDLAQALAEGLGAHVEDVRRRTGAADVVVQVDEPALPAVLAGAIPTASGFHRHRSVSSQAAAEALDRVMVAAQRSGATTVLHCCADDLPFDVLDQVAMHALSFDLDLAGPEDFDDLARWVERGRALWPGVIRSVDPPAPVDATELTKRVLAWWSVLGFSEVERLPDTVLTPTCGLAGASPAWARRAHELVAEVARNLSEEQGRIAL